MGSKRECVCVCACACVRVWMCGCAGFPRPRCSGFTMHAPQETRPQISQVCVAAFRLGTTPTVSLQHPLQQSKHRSFCFVLDNVCLEPTRTHSLIHILRNRLEEHTCALAAEGFIKLDQLCFMKLVQVRHAHAYELAAAPAMQSASAAKR